MYWNDMAVYEKMALHNFRTKIEAGVQVVVLSDLICSC